MCVWIIKIIQLHKIKRPEDIDLDKTDKSKECKVCHYNYFNNGFKSDLEICNGCDWGIKSLGNFVIILANEIGYNFFYVWYDWSRSDWIY